MVHMSMSSMMISAMGYIDDTMPLAMFLTMAHLLNPSVLPVTGVGATMGPESNPRVLQGDLKTQAELGDPCLPCLGGIVPAPHPKPAVGTSLSEDGIGSWGSGGLEMVGKHHDFTVS